MMCFCRWGSVARFEGWGPRVSGLGLTREVGSLVGLEVGGRAYVRFGACDLEEVL